MKLIGRYRVSSAHLSMLIFGFFLFLMVVKVKSMSWKHYEINSNVSSMMKMPFLFFLEFFRPILWFDLYSEQKCSIFGEMCIMPLFYFFGKQRGHPPATTGPLGPLHGHLYLRAPKHVRTSRNRSQESARHCKATGGTSFFSKSSYNACFTNSFTASQMNY